MRIEIINKPNGDVRAHAVGCQDISRETRHGEDHWAEDHDSKRDAYLDYNSDFIAEAEGDESCGYVIDFAPCLRFAAGRRFSVFVIFHFTSMWAS